jgi:hypothetical protein
VNTTKRLHDGTLEAPADRFAAASSKMSRDDAETIMTAIDLGILHPNETRAMSRLAFDVQAEPVDAEREDQDRPDRFETL